MKRTACNKCRPAQQDKANIDADYMQKKWRRELLRNHHLYQLYVTIQIKLQPDSIITTNLNSLLKLQKLMKSIYVQELHLIKQYRTKLNIKRPVKPLSFDDFQRSYIKPQPTREDRERKKRSEYLY